MNCAFENVFKRDGAREDHQNRESFLRKFLFYADKTLLNDYWHLMLQSLFQRWNPVTSTYYDLVMNFAYLIMLSLLLLHLLTYWQCVFRAISARRCLTT